LSGVFGWKLIRFNIRKGFDVKIPELLAPAGNLEKMKMAIHYGADAVYLGGEEYSLRNLAGNFTVDELVEAVGFAHENSARVYLATNIFPGNADLFGMYRYLEKVKDIPFDAYIVADPGVLDMVREISPDRAVHMSTQANTSNWRSARFWKRQGVTRVNLAREMSIDDIREVRKQVDLELEVFVHGAMCISYSGRCLLSNIMTGRNANRGECAHPCRWRYAIVEEMRPGKYFPIQESEAGTFIFNSKDLCLLPYLPDLVESGVDSLKIEGRMKGVHYVSSVVRVYREALDRFRECPERFVVKEEWLEELGKISHRGYTTGFFLGPPDENDHEYASAYLRSHEFVGIVTESAGAGELVIEVRNRIMVGEEVEFIGRGMTSHRMIIREMRDAESSGIIEVAHPNQRVRINAAFRVEAMDMIRREKIGEP
jgi:U32 family peptidase